MGQEGGREDSPTPQKDQCSKKEEGKMTQIINQRDMVCERSSENHNQKKEYRSSQGGQQDKERKGTDLHLFVLSVMASSTRPCRLTPVKRYLTAFYTARVTLNGDLSRRLDQSIAQHSNWLASFQSLPMICLVVCLDCALRAVTKR